MKTTFYEFCDARIIQQNKLFKNLLHNTHMLCPESFVMKPGKSKMNQENPLLGTKISKVFDDGEKDGTVESCDKDKGYCGI